MSDAFDPYHIWLGIPPEKQPPNHYDLLGVPLFEERPEVIEAAADRQMGHLRTYQTGAHGALSQKLLNEVAGARVCLLNAAKKAAYDRQLRQALQSPPQAATAGAPPTADEARRSRNTPPIMGVAASGVLLAACLIVGVLLLARRRPQEAVLVFQLPAEARHQIKLLIDEKPVGLPAAPEAAEHRCPPGEHRIVVSRPGFKPYEELVRVEAGQRKEISPIWVPQSHLVLQWPDGDLDGAIVEIDGQRHELAEGKVGSAANRLQVPLEPGRHQVRIARPGFVTIEQTVNVVVGKDSILKPAWEQSEKVPESPGASSLAGSPGKEETGTEIRVKGTGEPSAAKTPESRAPSVAAKPPVDKPGATPSASPELAATEAAQARYSAAVRPAEKLVAGWDFQGALAALAEVDFDEKDLAARLAARRDELQHMASLKARMIAEINAADPPLRKMDLMIRGVNGDIVAADQQGIACELITGRTETHAWHELGSKAAGRLLELVVDRDDADEWLSAGVFALACNDADSAEKFLAKAESLGAETDRYLGRLAAGAFAEAEQLLKQQEFPKAETALAQLEARYAGTSWFASHQAQFDAARAAAKAGLLEAEAEKLYAAAKNLFQEKRLFELRPLVEQLRTQYPKSRAVTEGGRAPSLQQMEAAVADVGDFFTVRKDGKGSFVTIQEAIDAAPPNSLIEIQDVGPYNEGVAIPAEKRGLTIRGKEGLFPLVTSRGANTGFHTLVRASAAGSSVEGLVLAHTGAGGHNPVCLSVGNSAGEFSARHCVLAGAHHVLLSEPKATPQVEGCFLVGTAGYLSGALRMRNCLWIGRPERLNGSSKFENVLLTDSIRVNGACEFRSCTLGDTFEPRGGPNLLLDCIVHSVALAKQDTQIDYCAFFGGVPPAGGARVGKNCFAADPQFVNPKAFDYRLLPTSPCRGKASDGGELGVRFTPEMAEMLRLAFELRGRGIIKF